MSALCVNYGEKKASFSVQMKSNEVQINFLTRFLISKKELKRISLNFRILKKKRKIEKHLGEKNVANRGRQVELDKDCTLHSTKLYFSTFI